MHSPTAIRTRRVLGWTAAIASTLCAVDLIAALPSTGATTSWLVPVAIGLLVLGAIVLAVTLVLRRRKRG